MRKLSTVLLLLVTAFGVTYCGQASKVKQLGFVESCFKENPDRDGLPLSQLKLLYEGVEKADDPIARQSLEENCPTAYENFLQ